MECWNIRLKLPPQFRRYLREKANNPHTELLQCSQSFLMFFLFCQKNTFSPVFLNQMLPLNPGANKSLRALPLLFAVHAKQAERSAEYNGIPLFEELQPHCTIRYGQVSA